MDLWIGTSGYSYADWVGDFYPPGTRPEQMLKHYARVFPLVELNFTFYRSPTKPMLLRVADKAPPGFQFLVKLPRSISHEESSRDLPGFRQAVEGLQERGQLLGMLCQLPQATHNTSRSRLWLQTIARELAGLGLAVEFRHHSWAKPGLPDWMAQRQLDLVAVDVPDLPGLFPRGWVQSSPRVYVRLHSRNAKAWYAGDKERYDYLYTDSVRLLPFWQGQTWLGLSGMLRKSGGRTIRRSSTAVGLFEHPRRGRGLHKVGTPAFPADFLASRPSEKGQKSNSALGEWVEGLGRAEGTERALLLFNNCHHGQAAVNARRMRQLVEEQLPGINVVSPFAARPPVQRSLFE